MCGFIPLAKMKRKIPDTFFTVFTSQNFTLSIPFSISQWITLNMILCRTSRQSSLLRYGDYIHTYIYTEHQRMNRLIATLPETWSVKYYAHFYFLYMIASLMFPMLFFFKFTTLNFSSLWVLSGTYTGSYKNCPLMNKDLKCLFSLSVCP